MIVILHYYIINNNMKIFSKILLLFMLQALAWSTPLMLEARSDFIESLAKSRIAVFFYG